MSDHFTITVDRGLDLGFAITGGTVQGVNDGLDCLPGLNQFSGALFVSVAGMIEQCRSLRPMLMVRTRDARGNALMSVSGRMLFLYT